MRKYLKSIVVLWMAPTEVREKAEKEMNSELKALDPVLRERAEQARGNKKWKIALAAKLKSVLADEETKRLHSQLKPAQSAAEVPANIGDVLSANRAATKATLLSLTFRTEWGTFIHSL
jgi:16S rRNA U1498 N3-methylase RsmE